MTHRRGRATVLTLLLLILLPVGCGRGDVFYGPYVVNYTGTPLTISHIHNHQTIPLGVTVDKGLAELGMFTDQCSDGTLLALDPSGRVVAQRDMPLCRDDTWVIGTAPSASP
jgi:hypothetical protein